MRAEGNANTEVGANIEEGVTLIGYQVQFKPDLLVCITRGYTGLSPELVTELHIGRALTEEEQARLRRVGLTDGQEEGEQEHAEAATDASSDVRVVFGNPHETTHMWTRYRMPELTLDEAEIAALTKEALKDGTQDTEADEAEIGAAHQEADLTALKAAALDVKYTDLGVRAVRAVLEETGLVFAQLHDKAAKVPTRIEVSLAS